MIRRSLGSSGTSTEALPEARYERRWEGTYGPCGKSVILFPEGQGFLFFFGFWDKKEELGN